MSESTGPPPSEGALSVNSDTDVLEKLCVRIHQKLVAPVSEPLATSDHRSAVGMMLKVRDILMHGRVEVSQKSKTCIVCSGVACMKRTHGGVERDEATGMIKTTVTLLFILLLLCEKSTDLQEDMYEEPKNDIQPEAKKPRTRIHRDDEQLIAAWYEPFTRTHTSTKVPLSPARARFWHVSSTFASFDELDVCLPCRHRSQKRRRSSLVLGTIASLGHFCKQSDNC